MPDPPQAPRRSFVRDNGLSLVLAVSFVVLLVGQSVAGMYQYNEDQQMHGEAPVTYGAYLTTPHFGEAVFENWESEFLQMAVYVLLTAFLFQRGSAESNDPDDTTDPDAEIAAHRADPDAPTAVRRGGWRLAVYRHSLSLALGALFLASFTGHALTGLGENNAERAEHGLAPETLAGYVGGSQFWFESLQNWQSEFLAVLAIVLLSVRLRESGSSESKPVWASHDHTGSG